jgi:hypothetical protein
MGLVHIQERVVFEQVLFYRFKKSAKEECMRLVIVDFVIIMSRRECR